MNENPKIKSIKKLIPYFTLSLPGGIILIYVCFYLISSALKEPYPQINSIGFGFIFGLFGFLSLTSIFSYHGLTIYDDRLEIKSILGYTKRVILLKDIRSWSEIDKQNKYVIWTDLVIYTEGSKYKISSATYKNYKQLKRAITSGKPRNIQSELKWLRRNISFYGIGFVIIGGLFLWVAYHSYKTGYVELKGSELTTIKDVITNQVKITKGSKNSRSIEIKLLKYPDFNFHISGTMYVATFTSDYVANVKTGDTISVKIKTDEYLTKLTKEKSLSFWDKTISSKSISVYSLSDKKNTYLRLSNLNRIYQSDLPTQVWMFGIVGFFMMGLGSLFILLKNSVTL